MCMYLCVCVCVKQPQKAEQIFMKCGTSVGKLNCVTTNARHADLPSCVSARISVVFTAAQMFGTKLAQIYDTVRT